MEYLNQPKEVLAKKKQTIYTFFLTNKIKCLINVFLLYKFVNYVKFLA